MSKQIMAVALILTAFMLQGCKKNMEYEPQDFFEDSQLKIAQSIYAGDEQLLKRSIASVSKEELNHPAKAKMTLLFWSILNASNGNATPERLRIITTLVKAGADPLQPQPNTPGSPAEFVLKGDKGVWIKAMLDGGLSANAKDKIHNEPIVFEALKAKNTESLKTMIKYGVDINTKDSLGRSLLINALYASKTEHIAVLLSHGADPYLKDNFNDDFVSLINKEISEKDNNNEYIQSLMKIRDSLLP